MPNSFNSEEDGPLFLHMSGKLDKRNDKKRSSGTRTFNAAKIGPVTTDDNDCIIVQRFQWLGTIPCGSIPQIQLWGIEKSVSKAGVV